MATTLRMLKSLAERLGGRLSLEELLGVVTDHAAIMLGVERASVRLFDASHSRLIAVARSGASIHEGASVSFAPGEGLVGWIAEHKLPIRSSDPQNDARFAHRESMVTPIASFLGVPLCAGERCIGVLSAVSNEPDAFGADHEEIMLVLSAIAAPYIEIARLSRLSQVDALTGTLNRRGLDGALPEAGTRERAAILPCTVALVDIDGFKRVNDEYGHAVGDELLKLVAEKLKGAVRASDAVIRLGGDEFLMVLSRIGQARGAAVAERARDAVASSPLVLGDSDVRVTITLGVARVTADEPRADILARADQALYEGKRHGRNCVSVASYPPSAPVSR